MKGEHSDCEMTVCVVLISADVALSADVAYSVSWMGIRQGDTGRLSVTCSAECLGGGYARSDGVLW